MTNILKKTLAVLDKKEKDHFIYLMILDIVISIADILSLALLLWIIQFYIQPDQNRDLSYLPGWLRSNSITLIGLFFLFFAAKNWAGFLIARAHYKFTGRVAVRISRTNLMNYQRAGFEDFVTIDSSAHIRTIAYQPFEFCQYMLSGMQQIITQSFLIILTITVIILFNAQLFLILLGLLLPPVVVVFYFMKKRMTTAKKHIQSSNERSFQYLLDALKGYVEGNIYDRNDFFLRRFVSSRQTFSKNLFDSQSMQSMPNRIIEVFAILGLFILIAIAHWSGNNDSATLLTIGAFVAAAYKIIPGIVKLMNAAGQMKAYEFSIEDLVQGTVIGPTRQVHTAPAQIEVLQLKNISFNYGDQPVVNNFSLTIKKGDFIGITGGSGMGKTTVFNLILGFLLPVKGEILVNDVMVDRISQPGLKDYWPLIAYVRQQSFFIHDTILRNITLEEEGYDREQLQNALHIAGLDKFISGFPEGINKIITENGKNISGGQQQRIALARAIYKNADLILLDEPFNELDETSVILLIEHFKKLSSEGKTVIMITHDTNSLSYCTKIVSLDEQK